MHKLSVLVQERLKFLPQIPDALKDLSLLDFSESQENNSNSKLSNYFPRLSSKLDLNVIRREKFAVPPLRVGVVLSGGQAAGGHNVITGLFDALKELNADSQLFGFLNGPSGIIKAKSKELTREFLANYRNQGGFDLIGAGRTKIETKEQFEMALATAKSLNLNGIVIIGGDDSNTNAAHLAEFFLSKNFDCSVVGVPKTIDGDLQNEKVEISFGFDTATKVYAEAIGNIARDAQSAAKYYFFVKLMGRSASHITLECALKTQPNLALIGEEIANKNLTLKQVVDEITNLVVDRSKAGKDYGVILIPEGVIEFLSDVKDLIRELNRMVAKGSSYEEKFNNLSSTQEKISYISSQLKTDLKVLFDSIPSLIQQQLILDRDSHGNVQVSKIETERLFIELVENELKNRADYTGKFSPQPIFCGYEGRCSLPTNFDANYCYNLGRVSALLIARKKTGFMAAITNLTQSVSSWDIAGVSLVRLMHMEERGGVEKPVIKKALVDLSGNSFRHYASKRAEFRMDDLYLQPGPIQFFGPDSLVNSVPVTLTIERA